jgi:hypothetical protein
MRVYFTGILSQITCKNTWSSGIFILLKNIRISYEISKLNPGLPEPNGFKCLLINLKDKNANVEQFLNRQISIVAETSFLSFYKDADVMSIV